MEGQGVTNYAADKPSYAYTTATTEFDDELIRRGVVTMEQAMTAKGASAGEAHRLAALAKAGKEQSKENNATSDPSSDDNGSYDSDDDLLDDDFLQNYRQQRIAELKEEQDASTEKSPKNGSGMYHGEAVPIQRPEWTRHVNEASHDTWVVVTLTSNNLQLTGPVETAATTLARLCPSVKFVMIPSKSAIDNWPDSNLPSIFVYRHGKMQQELVQMKPTMTVRHLQKELERVGGVEFAQQEVQRVQQYASEREEEQTKSLKLRLAHADDDEEDDDEVI